MYDNFTNRARKIMQLANQEAQRFNHEYIGTEHVLLGLIKEGMGVAANVLKNLDLDLRKIRLEIEKIVISGPDMVSLGKLPQTTRYKLVIQYAIEEATKLGHSYVGSEHLLLGLIRETEGVAAQVLTNLGVKLADVREETLSLLGGSPSPATKRDVDSGKAQQWLPVNLIKHRHPPICEHVLTGCGIAHFNGREWISSTDSQKITRKITWWCPVPVV